MPLPLMLSATSLALSDLFGPNGTCEEGAEAGASATELTLSQHLSSAFSRGGGRRVAALVLGFGQRTAASLAFRAHDEQQLRVGFLSSILFPVADCMRNRPFGLDAAGSAKHCQVYLSSMEPQTATSCHALL